MESAVILLLALTLGASAFLIFKLNGRLKVFKERYSGLIDLDDRKDKTRKELEELKAKYQIALTRFQELSKEVDVYAENLELSESGFYEPHFEFSDSEAYKDGIKQIREQQKVCIKNQNAIQGGEGWMVNNSKAKGKSMINKIKKQMLFALNGECDSLVANVNWNNYTRYSERLNKTVEKLEKLNNTQGLHFAHDFIKLKRNELRLAYEYKLKKHEEKELERERRAQLREEEKAKRDYEKAQKEADREEKGLSKDLEALRLQLEAAASEEKKAFEKKINELNLKLKEAREKGERAISMAQKTKAGYVYIISNIGSFGEGIFKIGMTRRLDPMDRIKELGDASVPFNFDLHALVYSENAPDLETKLHRQFEDSRLNYINLRREYFKVDLLEIIQAIQELNGEIEFVKDPEAREFRESNRKRLSFSNEKNRSDKFDSIDELFDIN